MKLPTPHETLVGCVWLPRVLAKARLIASGELPADYVACFCHPMGVDGQFLAHFALTKDDIVIAAKRDDAAVAEWFLSRIPDAARAIATWNDIAVNLGRAGYPMAERFPVALATTYRHVDARGLTSVFEVLEADERNS